MTQEIDKLIETLERAGAGENVDVEYVRALRLEAVDDAVKKVAMESWRRLVHFVDDTDIRSEDAGYGEQMKDEMRGRANELVDLLARRR